VAAKTQVSWHLRSAVTPKTQAGNNAQAAARAALSRRAAAAGATLGMVDGMAGLPACLRPCAGSLFSVSATVRQRVQTERYRRRARNAQAIVLWGIWRREELAARMTVSALFGVC